MAWGVCDDRWLEMPHAVLTAAVAALGLMACHSNLIAPSSVASVAVTPVAATLAAGDTLRLQAVPQDAAGNSLQGRTVGA